MKLIFMEYLASLKERGGLDLIIPDLLSEIGWTVISRPSVGTKQYGVDVAAVSTDGTEERVYLISIKSGDLRRSDWNHGEQSLRPSLDQIQDVYIPSQIPEQHRRLPVVIVLCIGGDVHESVRADIHGYIDHHKSDRISFVIWNGDKLSDLLLSGVLREHAVPGSWRSDFRKSVALVDEPEASFTYFRSLVNSIVDGCEATRRARLTAIRQIYVVLWTLFVWGRAANNIESGYVSSEYAVLVGWSLAKDHLEGKSGEARQLWQSVWKLIELHEVIVNYYLANYVEPRSKALHGLSAAVPSQESLDVNLRLFDLLGRVGMSGIWCRFVALRMNEDSTVKDKQAARQNLQRIADLLIHMISNNPILCTPIKDDQAIDVNIACLCLNWLGHSEFVKDWIGKIALATRYAYLTNGLYPCVHRDYRDLIEHPKRGDEYRETATAGSLLIPTLAVWAALTEDSETLAVLADFTAGPYQHSALQLWYPGDDSEEHIYRGSDNHGLAATNIKVTPSSDEVLSPIREECVASSTLKSLSAITRGLWPLVILACRHHRMPVPPHFWPLKGEETNESRNG